LPKQRVYVLFGGRSGEHEVSLMSAKNVLDALDPAKYDVVPIGITREGRWLLTGDPLKALTDGIEQAGGLPVALAGDPGAQKLLPLSEGSAANLDVRGDNPPVFFPVLHGTYGEDGTVQGLLEMAGVPYVGCGVLASAAAMDKGIAKALFVQAGLEVARWQVVLRSRWEQNPGAILADIEAQFDYPVFVKPANLGSSVGISKAKNRAALRDAISLAARFDRRILVEESINGQEIECSVLGNDEPVVATPGEIIPGHEFYDYQDKYFDDTSTFRIPADAPAAVLAEIQRQAIVAYRALDCSGMARVDFFYERGTGRILINEVNTIPGFTRISMYPKMWEASGLRYPQLIDRLVELALERWRDRRRNQTWV
jgi:D-alanine-D-alanine ligase